MKEEQHQFLRLLRQLPARLTAEQAAGVLNCQSHDVPILVAARLLKPLGNPQKNGIKFFATTELWELSKDKAWLVKVTNAVNHHWQRNNAARKNGEFSPETRPTSSGGRISPRAFQRRKHSPSRRGLYFDSGWLSFGRQVDQNVGQGCHAA